MQLQTTDIRKALRDLHRHLLEAQRMEVERITGRMSAGELLAAATDDLRFSWLRELSELLAGLDQAHADGDADAIERHFEQARKLIAPPDAGTPFGARYLRALQDDPAVVLAHRDARAALA
jgi:hypothetical protein